MWTTNCSAEEDRQDTSSKTAPEKKDIVKHYKGKLDIFDNFGVNKQIKQAFGRQVMLPSGGYLIVEKTEAMHVVDVNSGSRKGGRNQAQEKNALEINVEAAIEIARLLRLRDMGGIICVDFIDLYEAENRRTLHKALKDAMADDKAKHNVLPPSRFGVIETHPPARAPRDRDRHQRELPHVRRDRRSRAPQF